MPDEKDSGRGALDSRVAKSSGGAAGVQLGPGYWGSDVAAQALRATGVKYIALVPGSSFRGLHDSIVNFLGNRDPHMVLCLHEGQAAAIADGYARATDEPMAVALHANVGLMNACMSIYNSWCNRVPLLVFGATGPVDADRRRPWIDWVHTSKDQGALVRSFVKWDDQPASPKAVVESVLRANRITRTPPYGPVYICLDVDMQEAVLDKDVSIPDVARYQPPRPAEPSPETVDDVLTALKKARFPLLMFGRCGRTREAWQHRVRLAEKIGAPVMTSIHNAAAFPTDHPLHLLPVCGEKISEAERRLLNDADLILSFGWGDLAGYLRAATNRAQTQEPVAATVIHCALDGQLANGAFMDHQALPAVDIPVALEPDRFVSALLQALGDEAGPMHTPDLSVWRSAETRPPLSTAGMLTIDSMASELADFARADDVTLARLPIGWPSPACRFTSPLSYLGKDEGAAVGTGPGNTIGAALGLKGERRVVVGVLGDGDFLMGLNALWTASNMEIPVMFVIANNRSFFNDEVHQEHVARVRGRAVENKWIGQRLEGPTVDILAISRAQGFETLGPVEDPAPLSDALAKGGEIVRGGGRVVIDARIQPGYARH